MKKIDRYIAQNIYGLTGIVALALVAIYTFVSFVADIDQTGQGSFGLGKLLTYSLMNMPAALYTLFPIIAMLGTLMGLGSLASQGELTAMRAAGVSLLRIGTATVYAGILLALISLVLGDWLAPLGVRYAEAYRSAARYGVQPGLAGKPVWLREGDHVFHIQRLLAEDHIADVEVYTLRPDFSLAAAMRVDDARYTGSGWTFSGVHTTEFDAQGAHATQQAQMEWRGNLSPEVLHLFVLESDTLSAPGLARLIAYLDQNHLDASAYRLALWRKLVAPLTVMAMMLFAVPFVIGPLRNTGAGQRLLFGVLIGVAFYVLNEVTASL
ncbi:MAG TPA: LPS export ABC transporter permease LptG, partial [Nevskiaceae bacterium]|nr:LPS export ABC transporter permease LptG [Nevskiaceae bacterium]